MRPPAADASRAVRRAGPDAVGPDRPARDPRGGRVAAGNRERISPRWRPSTARRGLGGDDKPSAPYSRRAAGEGGFAGGPPLPISMKVLLENLLRNEDG